MTTPLSMPRWIRDAIVAHALEGAPQEICGLLRGRGTTVLDLVRAHNIASDPIDNYDVDPQSLLLQFAFEDAGDQMVAIYHSHPVSEAFPSATDAWSAHYPDALYVICSLEHEDRPVVRAFRLAATFPDLDVDHLREQMEFQEVRPGLFGYFQADTATIPPALAHQLNEAGATEIKSPFYIVFSLDPEGKANDARVVPVREHPVLLVE